MGFDQEDEFGTVPDDETRSRIAPPNAANAMPAVTLRGLPAPAAGSVEDLESRGAASHIAAAPIAKPFAPAASDTRKAADESRLSELQSSGSGISKIQNPIARGTLRGLETLGNIFVPRATAMIPGTEAHHNLMLGNVRGRIGEEEGEQQKEATTAKTAADTEEAEARTGLTEAQTAALGQPKPKEEKWSEFTGYTDTDGTPLIREENSGQVVRANDKKPPTGFKMAAPKNEKPDTAEQQLIDAQDAVINAKTPEERTAAQNKLANLKRVLSEYSALTQKPEHEPKQLAVVNGEVVELKPGMKIPEGATDAKGNPIGVKQPNANEIKRSDLAKNLNENLDQLEEIVTRRPDLFGKVSGRFTKAKEWLGSNDPDVAALKGLEDRLGMVVQSSHGMRSAFHVEESANSILNSYKNGPDAVKRAISDARKSAQTFINDAQPKSRGVGSGEAAGGTGEPERPANVPKNYVYKQNGPKGEGWYKP